MPFLVKAKTLFDNSFRQYCVPSDMSLTKGIPIVGMTCFGEDIVEVTCPKRKEVSSEEWSAIIGRLDIHDKPVHFAFEPRILRVAKDSEIQQHKMNLEHVTSYKGIFKQKISEYNLDMKIVRLYYPLSRDKLVCVYTASKRVDFRSLVKDLGSILKQRIELYQISIRDAFGLVSGCGTCGQTLCCSSGCHIVNDNKSNVRSSKSLGVCGKSKCCLSYEVELRS